MADAVLGATDGIVTRYSALCVLGMEIFYVLCIGYGLALSGNAKELHHSLFELVPVSYGEIHCG